MRNPRLEIRLDLLGHNATALVDRMRSHGIEVCPVTKATLGSPEIARVLLAAGATSLADSRIDNIETMRRGGLTVPMMLIRGPAVSEIDRVVAHTDLSCNSELDVIARLSESAQRQGRVHGIVLMIELGDLREGILPCDLQAFTRQMFGLPGVALRGIGTNLACQSGVVPDRDNMGQLSELTRSIERTFSIELDIVSGGNSANIAWAMDPGTDLGRINHLRLGESILLGCEPLGRTPLDGLHTDVFTLVAEVIESKAKPARPWGTVGQTAFGEVVEGHPADGADPPDGPMHRVLVSIGRQDTDHSDMTPPDGYRILGASSDHLVLDAGRHRAAVGSELRFNVGYRALLRAMTSPFVHRDFQPAP